MYCVSLYLDLDTTVHRISTSSALEFRIIYEFNFKSLKLIIYMKIKDNFPKDLVKYIFKSSKDGKHITTQDKNVRS